MKRFIACVLFVAIVVFCSSCGVYVEEEGKNKSKETSMFVLVETATTWNIVYHKETKVMYAVSNGTYSRGTFTLLVNADGSPMLWEG